MYKKFPYESHGMNEPKNIKDKIKYHMHYTEGYKNNYEIFEVFNITGFSGDSMLQVIELFNECIYSDRLIEMDLRKHTLAYRTVKNKGIPTNTAEFYQAYLRVYFDSPKLKLWYIALGVNKATGFDYHIYGFDYNKGKVT